MANSVSGVFHLQKPYKWYTPEGLFIEAIGLLKAVQSVFLEGCFDPMENIKDMVLLRPASRCEYERVIVRKLRVAHLQGLNRGARLNDPVLEMRG